MLLSGYIFVYCYRHIQTKCFLFATYISFSQYISLLLSNLDNSRLVKWCYMYVVVKHFIMSITDFKFFTNSQPAVHQTFFQFLTIQATFLTFLYSVAGIITWILTWLNPLRAEVCKSEVGIYDLQINLWQSFGALMQQGRHSFIIHSIESLDEFGLIQVCWK